MTVRRFDVRRFIKAHIEEDASSDDGHGHGDDEHRDDVYCDAEKHQCHEYLKHLGT